MGDLNGNAMACGLPVVLSTAVPEMKLNQAQHVADMNWVSVSFFFVLNFLSSHNLLDAGINHPENVSIS